MDRTFAEILADLNAAHVNSAHQNPMAETDRRALLDLTVEALNAGAASIADLRARIEAMEAEVG